MTDAKLKKLAKENNYEPTYELISFARLVLINAKIQDLKSVAINTQLAIEKEREACAGVCNEVMQRYKDDTALDPGLSKVGYMSAELCALWIRKRGKNDRP